MKRLDLKFKISEKNMMNYLISSAISFFICFGYIFQKERTLLFLLNIFVLFEFCVTNIFKNNHKFRIEKKCINIILIVSMMIISMLYTINFDLSFRYTQVFVLIFVIKIFIENNNQDKNSFVEIFINVLLLFSFIHVIATHLYSFEFPIITDINKMILTEDGFQKNISLKNYGINAGICGDHSYNAFLITIFCSIIFLKILNGKKSFVTYILFVFGVLALIYTGKRGLVLANVLACIVCFLYSIRKDKKILKKISITMVVMFFLCLLVSNIPATRTFINRFTGVDGTTLLNGREVLYSSIFENIKERFYFGSGINTTIEITGGNDGHNSYLQIFSELGIFGFLIYIYWIANNYTNNLKRGKNNDSLFWISLYYQTFFIVYGMSGNPLYQSSSLLLYFLLT